MTWNGDSELPQVPGPEHLPTDVVEVVDAVPVAMTSAEKVARLLQDVDLSQIGGLGGMDAMKAAAIKMLLPYALDLVPDDPAELDGYLTQAVELLSRLRSDPEAVTW